MPKPAAMRIAATLCLALMAAPALAEEAPTGIKRTPLQAIDLPEGYRTVTGLAEVAPGHASGMHTHPGIETGYVLEGEVLMSVEGEPDRMLKAGDSYVVPSGAKHDVKSIGSVPAKAVSVFVVDKT
ncbi:cupin domain-containing protein, partial [Mesorhizobium marinum]|uniref:cupin domain-containing protein n=1 Tax=Mesorhizobium marinum TaxID=3228790 RepID=UPI003465CB48